MSKKIKLQKLFSLHSKLLCKILLFTLLASLFTIVGCGSTKTLVEVVERTTHDTLYYNKVQFDSIYQNDSFLMDYHPSKEFVYLFDSVLVFKVDTMYIRDKQVQYKYKYLRDTTYIHQVDTIPIIQQVEVVRTERYTPWYAKAFAWLGVILLLLLIIRITIKIYFR